MKTFKLFFVEMTDTYGEDANYCWVNRFMVKASTMRGAISKVTRETGIFARKYEMHGDLVRYNAVGAGVCYFVSESDGEERDQYNGVKEL